ncbi:universal stress protein [Noviherbaspirillum sedimenti]|uniref:universal stress protein n=1 Tax=Noviherbaspirillum sedimenti TaxID=2320865 RepID=UPI0013145D39|nr:universal stress protein [Noviherbaspirillum sedimenti]
MITLGQWTDSPILRWVDAPLKRSIALRLLNQVSRPVLIVKKDSEKPYRRVVVAVDGTDSACAHIQQAYALAPDAELILVHAMAHSPANSGRCDETFDDRFRQMRMRQHEDALNRINDLLERCGVPQQQVVKVAEFGYAPKLILDSEMTFAADLLVIGRSSSSRFRRIFFGSVTSQILVKSRSDVLVVPPKGTGIETFKW